MLILASSSPRRQLILEQMQVSFRVEVAQVDEHAIWSHLEEERAGRPLEPGLLVESLAQAKAREVASRHPQELILAADTIVVWEGEILGKPANATEAVAMLQQLSGHSHEVYTGVALLSSKRQLVFHDIAQVKFNPLDDYQKAAIAAYVASGEALDKAGAYGIQDAGATLVAGIEGDFYTVMGLPLAKTRKILYQWGLAFTP